MANPLPLTDAGITYGPTGVRCGCGRDAHSNLSPCHAELAAWITGNIGETVLDRDEACDRILAAWDLTWPTSEVRTLSNQLAWTIAAAPAFGPYPTANEAAAAIVSTFAPVRRRDAQPDQN